MTSPIQYNRWKEITQHNKENLSRGIFISVPLLFAAVAASSHCQVKDHSGHFTQRLSLKACFVISWFPSLDKEHAGTEQCSRCCTAARAPATAHNSTLFLVSLAEECFAFFGEHVGALLRGVTQRGWRYLAALSLHLQRLMRSPLGVWGVYIRVPTIESFRQSGMQLFPLGLSCLKCQVWCNTIKQHYLPVSSSTDTRS